MTFPSRRDFVKSLGGAAVALPFGKIARATVPRPHAARIRFGYAAITWGGNDQQAIDDISSLGFPGIQLRSNVLTAFGDRPGTLRDVLAAHHLVFVGLSSGNVTIDQARRQQTIGDHVAHAQFLHDAGGRYLQITDERPGGRDVTPDDCSRLGGLLTEIGKRTAELGVPIGYHPHMGTIGERPENADRVLAAADPRYVKLLLDVAHYQQGGGDPVAAVRRYRDRLLFLHLKDVESPAPADAPGSGSGSGPRSGLYQFVELGRGHVDLKGVLAALVEVRYDGWVVVELDAVPEGRGGGPRSPRESAAVSKRYLESIGMSVS